jgi:Flp pilus assembly protein TadB
MLTDATPFLALLLLAGVLAWPALLARWRRRSTRDASDVACALEAYALETRRTHRCVELDATLTRRLARLRAPEFVAFRLAPNLPGATPELVADAASRLTLRLRRRIAFERKMLARTASGRRRGAIIGALPPLALLVLAALGLEMPGAALLAVAVGEGLGCWLLARCAQVAP